MGDITFSVTNRKEPITYHKQNNTATISMVANHTDMYKATKTGVIEGDGVSLTISEDARKELEEKYEEFLKKQEDANKLFAAQCDVKAGEDKAEALESELKNQARAMETARRIAKGGIVPKKDEQELMKYSSQMYQMAKQSALLAEQHKKYKKSLYEDDEVSREPEDEVSEPELFDVAMEVPIEELEGSSEINSESGISY